MSTPALLTEILKSAQTASSTSGLSNLLFNSLGELVKMGTILVSKDVQRSLDLNDVTDWTIFELDSLPGTCLNAPVKAAGMIFIGFRTVQTILRAGEGGQIYFRSTVSGVWQPWKKVTMTAA